MRLFLCSHFAQVGHLLEEEVEGKNIVFIPTASINEAYTEYVGTARELWKKMKTKIRELEISTAPMDEIRETLAKADIIYFTGGNTFFLIDQLKQRGVDQLIKQHVKDGKLYVGESAGAIICAKDLSYIQLMDEVPEAYSQTDYSGLGWIDFYPLPHYLCPPFNECTQQILDRYQDLDICTLTNSQALFLEDGVKQKVTV